MLTMEFELDTHAELDAGTITEQCREAAERGLGRAGADVHGSEAEYHGRLDASDGLLASGDVVFRVDLTFDGDETALFGVIEAEISAEARRRGAEVHAMEARTGAA